MHEHDPYASGEVLQCSAQRHTDTETRRREQRDERRGIEAQQLNDNQQQNGIAAPLTRLRRNERSDLSTCLRSNDASIRRTSRLMIHRPAA